MLSLKRFFEAFHVDCVFDVGSNDGDYARRLRSVGYEGMIISFEPHPKVYEELCRASRDDSRWHCVNVALDEAVLDVQFNIMQDSKFSSMHQPKNDQAGQIKDQNSIVGIISLTTATLNDLFPDLQRAFKFSRPFLKMDTQGHDIAVFRGACDVISNFVGLQSELPIDAIYEDIPNLSDSLAEYAKCGFRVSAFVPNTAGHFPDLFEVDCIMYNVERYRFLGSRSGELSKAEPEITQLS
jgi:FkbM family methyltransferase